MRKNTIGKKKLAMVASIFVIFLFLGTSMSVAVDPENLKALSDEEETTNDVEGQKEVKTAESTAQSSTESETKEDDFAEDIQVAAIDEKEDNEETSSICSFCSEREEERLSIEREIELEKEGKVAVRFEGRLVDEKIEKAEITELKETRLELEEDASIKDLILGLYAKIDSLESEVRELKEMFGLQSSYYTDFKEITTEAEALEYIKQDILRTFTKEEMIDLTKLIDEYAVSYNMPKEDLEPYVKNMIMNVKIDGISESELGGLRLLEEKLKDQGVDVEQLELETLDSLDKYTVSTFKKIQSRDFEYDIISLKTSPDDFRVKARAESVSPGETICYSCSHVATTSFGGLVAGWMNSGRPLSEILEDDDGDGELIEDGELTEALVDKLAGATLGYLKGLGTSIGDVLEEQDHQPGAALKRGFNAWKSGRDNGGSRLGNIARGVSGFINYWGDICKEARQEKTRDKEECENPPCPPGKLNSPEAISAGIKAVNAAKINKVSNSFGSNSGSVSKQTYESNSMYTTTTSYSTNNYSANNNDEEDEDQSYTSTSATITSYSTNN